MSLPPIFRTCPFLIIAIVSSPASVRRPPVTAEAKTEADQPFHAPMVLFDGLIANDKFACYAVRVCA